MAKPVSEWDADYILSLPKESNEFERKGSKKPDLTQGADENRVLTELAKRLSAFASSGGGKIIYGVNDDHLFGRKAETQACRSASWAR